MFTSGSLNLTHSSFSANALKRLYPNHTLIMTPGYGMNLLGTPGVTVEIIEKTPLITNLMFIPLPRSAGVPGFLIDQIEYGAFKLTWSGYEFIVFNVSYPSGFGSAPQYFILHEGPEDVSRLLLLTAGAYGDALHDEIWVYDQGWWQKSRSLWAEVQKASWNDVILKEEFKKALQKDVYGFFASEQIYKDLNIPWKRGLIMYGPPGNGKTISLKTIMKTCSDKGFAPLYVKSFQSYSGEEAAMNAVFSKARQLSPCVVILEDLDSLINDRNRSFFLNQLDGLEGNDGLLIIGTTNHFERLDPGLSSRPSRFDRKFKFDDPDASERKLYVQYWQKKLESNDEIDITDELVDEVVNLTDRFSFAYLKEAFVSSLVTFAGFEGEKPTFESILKDQIETLRKQLDKQVTYARLEPRAPPQVPFSQRRPLPNPNRSTSGPSTKERDIRSLLDKLATKVPTSTPMPRVYMSNGQSRNVDEAGRELHRLFEALPAATAPHDSQRTGGRIFASSSAATGPSTGRSAPFHASDVEERGPNLA
ncbi:P-loop containing nucleoside triphosphate hydrolase protein [Panaeolus papilionaceus]|nr:P-loop containing nucleoside triphosphate hydrolase protein [Panaeolus papilionaceus]